MKLNELVAVIGVVQDDQYVELRDALSHQEIASFTIGELNDGLYSQVANCEVKNVTTTKNSANQTRLVVDIVFEKEIKLTYGELQALISQVEKDIEYYDKTSERTINIINALKKLKV